MGNICSFCYLKNEQNEEFNEFNNNNQKKKKYWIVLKKEFENYQSKDKKYFAKTEDYDDLVENTSIQDIQFDNNTIEDENGTVKIIHY